MTNFHDADVHVALYKKQPRRVTWQIPHKALCRVQHLALVSHWHRCVMELPAEVGDRINTELANCNFMVDCEECWFDDEQVSSSQVHKYRMSTISVLAACRIPLHGRGVSRRSLMPQISDARLVVLWFSREIKRKLQRLAAVQQRTEADSGPPQSCTCTSQRLMLYEMVLIDQAICMHIAQRLVSDESQGGRLTPSHLERCCSVSDATVVSSSDGRTVRPGCGFPSRPTCSKRRRAQGD